MSKAAKIVTVNTNLIKHGYKVFNRRTPSDAPKEGVLTSVFGLTSFIPGNWNQVDPGAPMFGFNLIQLAKLWMIPLLRNRPDLEIWKVDYIPVTRVILPLVVSPAACRKAGVKVRQAKKDMWTAWMGGNASPLTVGFGGRYKEAPVGTLVMMAVRPVKKVFSI